MFLNNTDGNILSDFRDELALYHLFEILIPKAEQLLYRYVQ